MIANVLDRPRQLAAEPGTAGDDAANARRADRRAALLSIAGFWAFYYVINTLRMAVLPGHSHGPDELILMGRRLVVTLGGTMMTYGLYMLLRWMDGQSMRRLVATAMLASIPVAFAYSWLNYLLFYVIDPVDSIRREVEEHASEYSKPLMVTIDQALSWYFFIVAWGIMYIALSYAAKERRAERRAALYRAEAQSAQLRALRYQINPHFLFNTLNSLSTLVLRQRGEEAERMILNLSRFFRSSLTVDPADDVPLADEIRLQRLYLDIERVRFPDRLKVEIDVPKPLECCPVPSLILQPLVENAIKYGVARSISPVTVSIRAAREGDRLRLTVADDGSAPASAPTAEGAGVGLRNVRQRLSARFGTAAFCDYGPTSQGGFRVDLMLPLEGAAGRP